MLQPCMRAKDTDICQAHQTVPGIELSMENDLLDKYRTQTRSNFSKYQLPTFLPQMIHTLFRILWVHTVVNLNPAAV